MSEIDPVFDDDQRNQIREALERYRRRFGKKPLAVQKLAAEIAKATGDANASRASIARSIPWKTLQRFLNASHDTDNILIKHCSDFLRSAEPPPPYEVMGNAIVDFYDLAPSKPRPRMYHSGLVPQMFARKYHCYLKGTCEYPEDETPDPNWPIPEKDPFAPAFEIPYSILNFEPLPSTPFLKITEYVVNPLQHPVWDEIMALGSTVGVNSGADNYIGVLSMCAGPQLYVITLRQVAFRFPRFYMLFDEDQRTINPQSRIIGSCMTVSEETASYNPTESFEVKLFPVPEEQE